MNQYGSNDSWYDATLTSDAPWDNVTIGYDTVDTTSMKSFYKSYATAKLLKYKYSDTSSNGGWSSQWSDVEGPEKPKDNHLSAGKYIMPDRSILVINAYGNYMIEDEHAKVTYKANNKREFSPHLNASDMVADFLKYVGSIGVKKEDMMNLPINLFISWLIIEAAERDGDKIEIPRVNEDQLLLQTVKPRCLDCGRYIKRLHYRNQFPYCDPQHAARHLTLAT